MREVTGTGQMVKRSWSAFISQEKAMILSADIAGRHVLRCKSGAVGRWGMFVKNQGSFGQPERSRGTDLNLHVHAEMGDQPNLLTEHRIQGSRAQHVKHKDGGPVPF